MLTSGGFILSPQRSPRLQEFPDHLRQGPAFAGVELLARLAAGSMAGSELGLMRSQPKD